MIWCAIVLIRLGKGCEFSEEREESREDQFTREQISESATIYLVLHERYSFRKEYAVGFCSWWLTCRIISEGSWRNEKQNRGTQVAGVRVAMVVCPTASPHELYACNNETTRAKGRAATKERGRKPVGNKVVGA